MTLFPIHGETNPSRAYKNLKLTCESLQSLAHTSGCGEFRTKQSKLTKFKKQQKNSDSAQDKRRACHVVTKFCVGLGNYRSKPESWQQRHHARSYRTQKSRNKETNVVWHWEDLDWSILGSACGDSLAGGGWWWGHLHKHVPRSHYRLLQLEKRFSNSTNIESYTWLTPSGM